MLEGSGLDQGAEKAGGPGAVRLKTLYTLADLNQNPYTDTAPGAVPFIRGPQSTMYTKRPWTIRQYGGYGTAKESNSFYRGYLDGGGQGISVAFDLPTQRGLDSDAPAAIADVGKAGVAINSVEDMKILFEQIPLSRVSVSMTMNGAVLPILGAFIVAGEEQGTQCEELSGTIQNDIIKEFIVRNTYIYPLEPSIRIVADIVEFATKHMPRFNPISISGYHLQEAGADSVLELALTLADGEAYVKAVLERGLQIDEFAPRFSFFWGIGMDFYLEIAKLRAGRLLWSRLMNKYGARSERSCRLRAHAQTSGWSLCFQDPYNNIVRTAIEAMAAVFGGIQSLHTNAFDEAISLPTPMAARLARNTQLILQFESDIPNVIDPWGGSYLMESLTKEMADAAWAMIEEINFMGGMSSLTQVSWATRQIERCAALRQAKIDSGQISLIGVNCFQSVDDKQFDVPAPRSAESVLADQLQRLRRTRANRDRAVVKQALDALAIAARDPGKNLVSFAVNAMRARATVGEVSQVLEQCFGRHRAGTTLRIGDYMSAFNDVENWARLKARVADFTAAYGRPPRLLIAKLGQDGHDRGAKIIASSLVDLGYDIDLGPLFQSPQDCARQAIENDVHAIGISTLAGAHLELVVATIDELKQLRGGDIGVFVGGVIPVQDHDKLRAAGVIGIYGPGTPIPIIADSVLSAIMERTEGDANGETHE